MGSSAHRLLGLVLVLAPAAAFAQTPAGTATGAAQAPAQPSDPTPPAGGGAAPAGGTAAPAGSAAPKPAGTTAGFTFSDKPVVRRGAPVVRAVRRGGPVATLPGFEETSDGGSRLFVELTQNVPVEERRAQGVLTYVIKGAHVTRYNNTNALVTVHFNTPVARARLVPQGNDLFFIIDLRAQATPTFKVTENADHSAMLTIDFPKGDFTNVATATDTAAAPAPAAAPKKMGTARGGKKGGGVPAVQQQQQTDPAQADPQQGGGTGPKP